MNRPKKASETTPLIMIAKAPKTILTTVASLALAWLMARLSSASRQLSRAARFTADTTARSDAVV
ncbi:MAG: hypothetical protein ACRDTN_06650, partial [Mycobacterium sp.]